MKGRLVRAALIFLLLFVSLPVSVSAVESLTVTATPVADGAIQLSWAEGSGTFDIYYSVVDLRPDDPELTGVTGTSVTIPFDS
ncbi:MAG: hypothetical protein KO463_00445, partial [Candidatus Methanofastidiosa archaeon]|nr:hypothetical protein [Candidatus Methanofastidiosa archaeon]